MDRGRFLIMSAALACAPAAAAAADPGDEAALRELLAALNTRSDRAIAAVIARRFINTVPASQRLQNLKRLSEHGPFTISKMLPSSDSATYSALVLDGDRIPTTWTVHRDATGRITGVQVEAGASPPPPGIDTWTDLHDLVARLRAADGSPGIAIAVLSGADLRAAADGVRTPGGAAVGTDEPWKIGSIGKPLCTSVIARLIERGALDWSTPVSRVLKTGGMNAAYADVTLEELMHHRGGIQADTDFTRAMVDRIAGHATDVVAIRQRYATDILSRPPVGKRGDYEYSNAGFALLGHIAEVTAGKPYETLLHEEVFAPLGMSGSYAHGDALPPGHPIGHRRGPNGPEPADGFAGPLEIMVAPAGGGIWLTMQDLARFGGAHMLGLQGKDGYLRASTIARLHAGAPEPGGGLVYACGWGITQPPGIGEMHGHNGGDGTFFADFGVFPKLNVVVASAMNFGGPSGAPEQAVLAVGRRYARGKNG